MWPMGPKGCLSRSTWGIVAFVLGRGYLKPQGIYRTVLRWRCQGSLQLASQRLWLYCRGRLSGPRTKCVWIQGWNGRKVGGKIESRDQYVLFVSVTWKVGFMDKTPGQSQILIGILISVFLEYLNSRRYSDRSYLYIDTKYVDKIKYYVDFVFSDHLTEQALSVHSQFICTYSNGLISSYKKEFI